MVTDSKKTIAATMPQLLKPTSKYCTVKLEEAH